MGQAGSVAAAKIQFKQNYPCLQAVQAVSGPAVPGRVQGVPQVALYIREQDVKNLLGMDDVLAAVEEAFRMQGEGRIDNLPRRRVRAGGGGTVLHTMAAAVPHDGAVGLKAYTTGTGGARFVVLIWDKDDGRLLAVIEADALGQMRTGAASGVATRHLALPEADTAGIFGSGYQAETQLAAVCAVRPIKKVLAWSRNQDRLRDFCRRMEEQLGISVEPAPSPRELVDRSLIITTMTTSREPVFDGRWLHPGTHINAAGSNSWLRREIDTAAVERSDIITVDDLGTAELEAGDLLGPAERGRLHWGRVRQLGDVVAGRIRRETPEQITLFSSQGTAFEDVSTAMLVYRRAREAGMGREIG